MKLTKKQVIDNIAESLDKCIGESIYLADVVERFDCVGVIQEDDMWLMDYSICEELDAIEQEKSDNKDADNHNDYDAISVGEMLHVNRTYDDREIYYFMDLDEDPAWNAWRDKYDYEQVVITKEIVEEFRKIG